MSGEIDAQMHETRTVREEGESIVVTIPKVALERSGLEVEEDAMIGSVEDGPVMLLP